MPSSMPFVKDKRLRALAIDAPKRSALLPDVPTLVEQGYTGYESSPWFGLAAPAGTPKAVIERLQLEINAVLKQPEVIRRLAELGAEPVGGTPAEFAALIKADAERLGRVIRDAGITLD
jgi:tripartite-type tricarboxylate transporter receptor subunit TctC